MAMSLQQTKTRIRSVSSTKKITKAMEAVQEQYKYLYYSETDLSVGEE